MNAATIEWGIELETTLPNTDLTPIGSYHRGLPVEWLPAGWRAESDSSIRTQAPGRHGCEFVSPRLRGLAGLHQAMEAAAAIGQRGGRVNPTCGLHVTVGFPATEAKTLARLISLIANHERGLYATTGTRRRERGTYSKAIKSYAKWDDAKRFCERDRYHMVNLTHLARGDNRIEFRAFAGTLNPTKIAGHVLMCLGLIELASAKSRCSAWSYEKEVGKRSCWDRAGDGQTEVNRLFYRLGWTTGWYKGEDRRKRYGELRDEERTPDWKAIKQKLLEMGRKYDAAG